MMEESISCFQCEDVFELVKTKPIYNDNGSVHARICYSCRIVNAENARRCHLSACSSISDGAAKQQHFRTLPAKFYDMADCALKRSIISQFGINKDTKACCNKCYLRLSKAVMRASAYLDDKNMPKNEITKHNMIRSGMKKVRYDSVPEYPPQSQDARKPWLQKGKNYPSSSNEGQPATTPFPVRAARSLKSESLQSLSGSSLHRLKRVASVKICPQATAINSEEERDFNSKTKLSPVAMLKSVVDGFSSDSDDEPLTNLTKRPKLFKLKSTVHDTAPVTAVTCSLKSMTGSTESSLHVHNTRYKGQLSPTRLLNITLKSGDPGADVVGLPGHDPLSQGQFDSSKSPVSTAGTSMKRNSFPPMKSGVVEGYSVTLSDAKPLTVKLKRIHSLDDATSKTLVKSEDKDSSGSSDDLQIIEPPYEKAAVSSPKRKKLKRNTDVEAMTSDFVPCIGCEKVCSTREAKPVYDFEKGFLGRCCSDCRIKKREDNKVCRLRGCSTSAVAGLSLKRLPPAFTSLKGFVKRRISLMFGINKDVKLCCTTCWKRLRAVCEDLSMSENMGATGNMEYTLCGTCQKIVAERYTVPKRDIEGKRIGLECYECCKFESIPADFGGAAVCTVSQEAQDKNVATDVASVCVSSISSQAKLSKASTSYQRSSPQSSAANKAKNDFEKFVDAMSLANKAFVGVFASICPGPLIRFGYCDIPSCSMLTQQSWIISFNSILLACDTTVRKVILDLLGMKNAINNMCCQNCFLRIKAYAALMSGCLVDVGLSEEKALNALSPSKKQQTLTKLSVGTKLIDEAAFHQICPELAVGVASATGTSNTTVSSVLPGCSFAITSSQTSSLLTTSPKLSGCNQPTTLGTSLPQALFVPVNYGGAVTYQFIKSVSTPPRVSSISSMPTVKPPGDTLKNSSFVLIPSAGTVLSPVSVPVCRSYQMSPVSCGTISALAPSCSIHYAKTMSEDLSSSRKSTGEKAVGTQTPSVEIRKNTFKSEIYNKGSQLFRNFMSDLDQLTKGCGRELLNEFCHAEEVKMSLSFVSLLRSIGELYSRKENNDAERECVLSLAATHASDEMIQSIFKYKAPSGEFVFPSIGEIEAARLYAKMFGAGMPRPLSVSVPNVPTSAIKVPSFSASKKMVTAEETLSAPDAPTGSMKVPSLSESNEIAATAETLSAPACISGLSHKPQPVTKSVSSTHQRSPLPGCLIPLGSKVLTLPKIIPIIDFQPLVTEHDDSHLVECKQSVDQLTSLAVSVSSLDEGLRDMSPVYELMGKSVASSVSTKAVSSASETNHPLPVECPTVTNISSAEEVSRLKHVHEGEKERIATNNDTHCESIVQETVKGASCKGRYQMTQEDEDMLEAFYLDSLYSGQTRRVSDMQKVLNLSKGTINTWFRNRRCRDTTGYSPSIAKKVSKCHKGPKVHSKILAEEDSNDSDQVTQSQEVNSEVDSQTENISSKQVLSLSEILYNSVVLSTAAGSANSVNGQISSVPASGECSGKTTSVLSIPGDHVQDSVSSVSIGLSTVTSRDEASGTFCGVWVPDNTSDSSNDGMNCSLQDTAVEIPDITETDPVSLVKTSKLCYNNASAQVSSREEELMKELDTLEESVQAQLLQRPALKYKKDTGILALTQKLQKRLDSNSPVVESPGMDSNIAESTFTQPLCRNDSILFERSMSHSCGVSELPRPPDVSRCVATASLVSTCSTGTPRSGDHHNISLKAGGISSHFVLNDVLDCMKLDSSELCDFTSDSVSVVTHVDVLDAAIASRATELLAAVNCPEKGHAPTASYDVMDFSLNKSSGSAPCGISDSRVSSLSEISPLSSIARLCSSVVYSSQTIARAIKTVAPSSCAFNTSSLTAKISSSVASKSSLQGFSADLSKSESVVSVARPVTCVDSALNDACVSFTSLASSMVVPTPAEKSIVSHGNNTRLTVAEFSSTLETSLCKDQCSCSELHRTESADRFSMNTCAAAAADSEFVSSEVVAVVSSQSEKILSGVISASPPPLIDKSTLLKPPPLLLSQARISDIQHTSVTTLMLTPLSNSTADSRPVVLISASRMPPILTSAPCTPMPHSTTDSTAKTESIPDPPQLLPLFSKGDLKVCASK